MSNSKNNWFKKFKAGLLAFFQTIAEFISILSYFVFILAFGCLFFFATYKFIHLSLHAENIDVLSKEAEDFIKKSLTSFELLFVAPIPILVIFAFKAIIVRIYPDYFNEPEYDQRNLLKLDLAKKTFTSSIIGVLATSILGSFLAHGETFDILALVKLLVFLGFLSILVVYYKILSDHSSD